MRILLIHPNDLLTTPTTIRVVRLAQELVQLGHHCTLAYFIEAERRQKGAYTSNVDEIECEGLITVPLHPFALLDNVALLKAWAKKSDVVHIQKAIPYAALPTVTAAKMAGRPLHYDWDDLETELAHLIHRRPFYPHAIKTFENQVPKLASTLTYSSKPLLERAKALGTSADRCFWLPVGSDLEPSDAAFDRAELEEKWRFTKEDTLLVYSGHLEAGSGAKLFLETANQLKTLAPDLHIKALVLGGGLHLDAYKRFARDIGMAQDAIFTNYRPRHEVSSFLAAADLNVISLEDSRFNRCKSPLKLLEAMASGRPLIASDVGEISTLLGSPDLTVPPNAPEMARSALSLLHKSEKARNNIGQALKDRVKENFTWRHAAKRLEQAYQVSLDPLP